MKFLRPDYQWENEFVTYMIHVVLPGVSGTHSIDWIYQWQLASLVNGIQGRGANMLSSRQVYDRVKGTDTSKTPAFALLFDDGYDNQHTYGTPVLQETGGHGIVCVEANPQVKFKAGGQLAPATLQAMVDSGVWSVGAQGYVGHGDGVTRYKAPDVIIDGQSDTFYNNRLYLAGPARYETDLELYQRLHDDLYQTVQVLSPYGDYRVMTWPLGYCGFNGNASDTIPEMLRQICEELSLVSFSYSGQTPDYFQDQGPTYRTSPHHTLQRINCNRLKWHPAQLTPPKMMAPSAYHTNGWQDNYNYGVRVPNVGWVVGRAGAGKYYVGYETSFLRKQTSLTVQPNGGTAWGSHVFPAYHDGDVYVCQFDPPRITKLTDINTGAAELDTVMPSSPLGMFSDGATLYWIEANTSNLRTYDPITQAFGTVGALPDAGYQVYWHGAIYEGHLYTYYSPKKSIRKIRLSDRVLVDEYACPEGRAFYPMEADSEGVRGVAENQRAYKLLF